MLLEGSKLTKEDRESQLYDDFEHFRQHKEEPIQDYYVRFAKLINDMRNIKMTMSKLQLNSKFVNNMLPEWAQPTADPLTLLSNVSNTQHGSPSSSTSSFTQLPPPRTNSSSPADDLIENLTSTLALLTQSYRTFLPQTNNQLRTSSNLRNQATGGSTAGYGEAQNRVGNVNQGQARPGQARTVNCYNCNGTRNGVALDAEHLLFLAGGQDNAFDDDVDEQPFQDLALNVDNVFQAKDCDAFHSDVDEAPTAQTMFMANLSSADPITDEAGPSYDSDILSEVQDHDQYLDDTCAYQEEHVMHDNVQLDHVVDLHADYTSVSNMISYDQEQVELYERRAKFELTEREQKINEQLRLNKVAIGYKIPLCLTRTKQAQSALYNGHEILKDNHAPAKVYNAEDTLEIAEITRKKMNAKMTDPECVTHKVKIASHDYSKENLLATFTSQKQLTPEQIYWSSDLMKLKSEALKERAKASRPIKAFTVITPTELTDGERGFEQTKACYLQEVIPFFKTIKDNFEGIQKALTKEVKEMKDVFEELEAEVAQCAVDRKHDAIDRKTFLLPMITYLLNVYPKRNNRDAHLDYLRNLKESVETIRDIVKEAKVLANTPLIKKKQVTIAKPSDRQDSNKQVHVVAVKPQKTNVLKASGSHPKSNPKTNRIPPAKGANKLHIEDLLRTNKSHLKTTNHVDSSSHLKRTVINSNLDSMCRTCNKCLTSFDHDMCVAICMKSVVRPHSTHHNCKVERKIKQVWKPKQVKRKMKQVERNTLSTLSTIGDLKFQTLHLCLVSNAGRTDCPLFDSGMTTLVLSWFMEIMRLVKASSPGYTVWKD
nr:hypothetical protein [Tanacetum cinerariifolium]